VIVYANGCFEVMFGYNPGELVGNHVRIVNDPGGKSPEAIAKGIIKSLNNRDNGMVKYKISERMGPLYGVMPMFQNLNINNMTKCGYRCIKTSPIEKRRRMH
jgi:hypothetical protein